MKTLDLLKEVIQFKVAIVVSRFNSEVTEKLLDGAITRFKEKGFSDSQIVVVKVPGAVEIPLIAQKLAQQSIYDAIVTLGAVIRGDTDHYDYVCSMVSEGCQHVSLQNDIPVIFGVLTTDNDEQAMERCGGKHGNKGCDAADAAIEMVALLRALE